MVNRLKDLVVVTDMDEVLVNISPRVVDLAIERIKEKYPLRVKYYFPDDLLEKDDSKRATHILARDQYYVSDYLKHKLLTSEFTIPKIIDDDGNELIDELTYLLESSNEEQVGVLVDSIVTIACKEIFEVPGLYDGLKPTQFGLGLVHMSKQHFIKEIHVVSHTFDSMIDEKSKWIMELFNFNNKVKFIPVPLNKSKSDYINTLEYYDMFADDRIDILHDAVKNTKSEGVELIVPKLGYNNLRLDGFAPFKIDCLAKGCTLKVVEVDLLD